jgi:hypothetical protein
MPSPNLMDLMRLYASHGIADWNDKRKTHYGVQKRARECLGAAIAENKTEAFVTIGTIYNESNADRLRFIPMPKRPKHGIERAFFIPVNRINDKGVIITTFELFLLVKEKFCLAYRFELPHPAPTVHDYSHVQMSHKMLRETIPTAVPNWLPIRHPAFPLSISGSLRMFLTMITAIHGYSGGTLSILQEIFQQAGRSPEASLYVSELKEMLG